MKAHRHRVMSPLEVEEAGDRMAFRVVSEAREQVAEAQADVTSEALAFPAEAVRAWQRRTSVWTIPHDGDRKMHIRCNARVRGSVYPTDWNSGNT